MNIVLGKVEKLNWWESSIKDEYIEKYLAEAKDGKWKLYLTATRDSVSTYSSADYIFIAALERVYAILYKA